METPDEHYLCVALRPGILSPSEIAACLKAFGSAKSLIEAPEIRLRGIGLSPNRAAKARAAWRSLSPNSEAYRLKQENIKAIGTNSELYPPLLKQIPDPPPLLFVRGNPDALSGEFNLSVVGSRKITPYGSEAVRMLIEPCARRGATVISGLAFGIDAAAHRAALRVGGLTAAVLASGVDRASVGPKANLNLSDEIVSSGGCLVSERPPGAYADKRSFPLRNRIIAGLSRASIIVEAAHHSGSMVTARLALEIGRDVLAVPGPITSQSSEGTNKLILDGAEPAISSGQLCAVLGLPPESRPDSALFQLNDDQKSIATVLADGPKNIDKLVENCGLTTQRALVALAVLETEKIISQSGHTVRLISRDN